MISFELFLDNAEDKYNYIFNPTTEKELEEAEIRAKMLIDEVERDLQREERKKISSYRAPNRSSGARYHLVTTMWVY